MKPRTLQLLGAYLSKPSTLARIANLSRLSELKFKTLSADAQYSLWARAERKRDDQSIARMAFVELDG